MPRLRGVVLRSAALVLCALLGGVAAASAQTVTTFSPSTGLFKVQHQTADLIDAELMFWRKEWDWLGLGIKAEGAAPNRRVRWLNTDTGLSVEAAVTRPEPNALTWQIKASEDAARGPDTYGAIVFRISKTALKELGIQAVPQLLPDKSGWTLDLGSGEQLSVTFDKPLGRLEFERGDIGEIRAYLIEKNDKPNSAELRMTVTSPAAIGASAAERLAPKSPSWRQQALHWNRSPVDLSFLNAADKPAGKRGFLRAHGEDFVFEDGSKARFWGTNVTAYALFNTTPPELVRNQAKRIAQLGFNLVRIHHHDSAWVAPNVFNLKAGDSTRELNAYALSRIDWWIACLKAEGIYVWLDLHVGREVTAKDGVDGFSEIGGGAERGKIFGFSYVNDSVQARMKEFAGAYLTHVNQHTGLAYKDDPAVVAVLITNENDVSHHFGNMMLPDKNVPWHNERFMRLAGEFAARHGLDTDKVWRSWEFGPNKLFLADLEHRLHSDMTAHLRGLGVKAPIVGTNFWGQMSIAGLPSLAAADFIDVHSYGTANEVENNPRYKPGLASWIAAGAVTGKPLTVSEWNVEPFPVFDRFQTPLHLAAIASLQGWNGLLQYAYSQSPIAGTIGPSNWEAFNDPAMIATLPAAALLYRGRHVSEGPVTYSLQLPPDAVTGEGYSPFNSRAIRTLTETSRFRITLPRFPQLAWLEPATAPAGAKVIETADYDAVGPGKTGICSDTGEICRDWVRGVVTVDTPKSQIASGWIGGQTLELADATVALSTRNASVAVQSLDDSPIAKSGKILISAAAQAIPVSPGRLPYFTEPVEGRVMIRARPGLKLSILDATGDRKPFNTTRRGDSYEIFINDSFASFWGILE